GALSLSCRQLVTALGTIDGRRATRPTVGHQRIEEQERGDISWHWKLPANPKFHRALALASKRTITERSLRHAPTSAFSRFTPRTIWRGRAATPVSQRDPRPISALAPWRWPIDRCGSPA